MLIGDIGRSGSGPVLERMFQFAGARQRLLVNNIANMDTPDFRPMDVNPKDFQNALAKAVKERRANTGGERGELRLGSSREIVPGIGSLKLIPKTSGNGVLAHNRNNTDMESMMRDLGENSMVYRTVTDFMRRNTDILRTAISQRV